MVIEVKVLSYFRRYLPVSKRRLDGDRWQVPAGANVADVLAILNIPQEQDKVLLVNNRSAEEVTVLHAGDVLQVFPPILGG